MPIDRDKVRREFASAVNMSSAEMEEWLGTAQSRKVGFKGADGSRTESVGHASGRRIAAILRKRDGELTDDDSSICARSSAMCIVIARSGLTMW